MEYPDEHVMGTLAAIDMGQEFAVDEDSGRMAVRTIIGWWEIYGGEIDLLFEKGWVDQPAEDRVSITDKGRYWLKRWMEKQRSLSRKRQ